MIRGPSLGARLIVALGVAATGAAISWAQIRDRGYATDFAWFWVAGRAVLHGQNPYLVVQPGGPYHFDAGFMYPLPAAITAAPLGALPIFPASILFAALSAGGLAFAMTRDGWWRLPALMSFPMLWAISAGQWAPLIAAAALSSRFAWAAACKPTLGLSAFLARPSWRFLAIAAGLTTLAFVIDAGWPVAWVDAMRSRPSNAGGYAIPLLVPGGLLLLLATLRWRTFEGRLLLGMALVPQTMLFYDQLALGLLARTRMQALVWGLWSYLALPAVWLIQRFAVVDQKADSLRVLAYVIVWLYYLPALAWVLRSPNEGDVPAWIDRLTVRWPRWLRGVPA